MRFIRSARENNALVLGTRLKCDRRDSGFICATTDYRRAFFRIRLFKSRIGNFRVSPPGERWEQTLLAAKCSTTNFTPDIDKRRDSTCEIGREGGNELIYLHEPLEPASLYDPIRPEEVTTDTGEKSAIGPLCVKWQVEKKSTTLIYIFILNQLMRQVSWLTIGPEDKFFCLQISRRNLLKKLGQKKQIQ